MWHETFYVVIAFRIRAAEEPIFRDAGRFDTGKLLDVLQKSSHQLIDPVVLIAGGLEIEFRQEQAVARITDVDLLKIAQGANKESGANQQDKREDDLRDD